MAVMNEIGYRFPRIESEKKQEINNGSFFIIVVDHQAMQNAEDSRGKENKFSFVDDNLCCPGTLTHRNKLAGDISIWHTREIRTENILEFEH